MSVTDVSKYLGADGLMIGRVVAGVYLLCIAMCGQQLASTWQEDVRRYAEAKDWSAAMAIVDREINRAPRDMDVRAWRARVLMWSGKLAEAELEYHVLITAAPNDPDNWLGLATLYSREGRTTEALQALDRAVDLDPKRSDIHVARARTLRALGSQDGARLEFNRTLDLDPTNAEGRAGLGSLRDEPRHEVRVGVNTDLFNFTDTNQDEGLTLISRWTPEWGTLVAFDGYHWGGTEAEKFVGSLTRKFPRVGALTVGGAAAHDNGVIPKDEWFFDYDQGFRLHRTRFLHGLEIVYGQHWYWYTTARILTINETMLFYLPRDWTWSLGLIEARSHFLAAGAEWRPSGITRLGFPIANWEQRRLGGNVFFAVGTENFAQVNQIGEFSSQTFGGGLRLQLTARQDVTGFADYQKRTQDRTESSFGFTYGIRF
jgi:tetratricopeptide (TPR) repeat protein